MLHVQSFHRIGFEQYMLDVKYPLTGCATSLAMYMQQCLFQQFVQ